MRFFEVDSAVDAIMSAAMIAQNRASQRDKQGKLSMNGFLQMLANAGVVVDYEGFKTVFDTNPQLANVIAKFDKDSITFASADAEDEGAGYEEPQTDMPDDERVAKMAQRATKMRTREFVETKLNEDDEQALMRQLMRKDGIDPDKVSDGGIFDKYRAMARKQLGLDEAELPPHLSKMFGKDGTQVDTRTDVMKQMRDIVDNKSAMEVEFGDGKQMVDMFTASVLVQVYDKVNPKNKEAIVQRVGTIEKFTKLMPQLFKMISKNESIVESITEGLYDAYAAIDDDAKIVATFNTTKQAQKFATKNGLAVIPLQKGKDVGDKVTFAGEGKSPHKKGTEKYRKHMAAMHAGESVNEAWQAFKERSLTKAEKSKMKHYEKKLPKSDFIDRYGKEQGEAIYYATATKMAKKNA